MMTGRAVPTTVWSSANRNSASRVANRISSLARGLSPIPGVHFLSRSSHRCLPRPPGTALSLVFLVRGDSNPNCRSRAFGLGGALTTGWLRSPVLPNGRCRPAGLTELRTAAMAAASRRSISSRCRATTATRTVRLPHHRTGSAMNTPTGTSQRRSVRAA